MAIKVCIRFILHIEIKIYSKDFSQRTRRNKEHKEGSKVLFVILTNILLILTKRKIMSRQAQSCPSSQFEYFHKLRYIKKCYLWKENNQYGGI